MNGLSSTQHAMARLDLSKPSSIIERLSRRDLGRTYTLLEEQKEAICWFGHVHDANRIHLNNSDKGFGPLPQPGIELFSPSESGSTRRAGDRKALPFRRVPITNDDRRRLTRSVGCGHCGFQSDAQ